MSDPSAARVRDSGNNRVQMLAESVFCVVQWVYADEDSIGWNSAPTSEC